MADQDPSGGTLENEDPIVEGIDEEAGEGTTEGEAPAEESELDQLRKQLRHETNEREKFERLHGDAQKSYLGLLETLAPHKDLAAELVRRTQGGAPRAFSGGEDASVDEIPDDIKNTPVQALYKRFVELARRGEMTQRELLATRQQLVAQAQAETVERFETDFRDLYQELGGDPENQRRLNMVRRDVLGEIQDRYRRDGTQVRTVGELREIVTTTMKEAGIQGPAGKTRIKPPPASTTGRGSAPRGAPKARSQEERIALWKKLARGEVTLEG